MTAALLLSACAGPGDGPPPPATCAGQSDVQHGSPLAIRTAHEGCGTIDLAVDRVLGEGGFAVDFFTEGTRVLPRVTATEDGSVLRGLVLVGRAELAGEEPLRVWRQGFGSDDLSGVFEAGPVALEDGVPALGGDGPDAGEDPPGTSWWGGLVGRPDGGAIVVGATSARQTRFAVAFDEDGTVWAVWGHGEGIALDTGGFVFLDGLYTGVGADPNALLRGWAEKAAAVSEVALPSVPPPVGWTSAAALGPTVTEDDVRAHLAAAVAANADPALADVGLLHVGDGWAVAWGEWTANERFPSGTAALAADIEAAGLVPGLSLAPFHVARTAPIYLAHPDWWLRGPDGAELDDEGHALLDVTHPEAAAWLAEVVAARVAEGWRWLEIERAEAAAREAVRAEPLTGIAAFAEALRIVREAAGPGTWLALADAPWLPSAGFADSVRTGPDPAPERVALRAAAAATAARGFANGRLFWSDPGALRADAPLDATEAHGSVVAAAVAGGVWRLGDDLRALPADRLALALSEATEARGADVSPDDPLAAAVPWGEPAAAPVRWSLSNGWTALLSLGDAAVEVASPGGIEVLDGETAAPGPRTIAPGDGELWR